MSEWCDLVTIHGVAGPSVMKGLQSGKSQGRLVGALIVAEMSSKDNLINKEYSDKCVDIFRAFKSEAQGVATVGLISQTRLCQDPDSIQMTPGVNLSTQSDSLGQTYVSVEEAVCQKGADAVIVGRGITQSPNADIASTARKYRDEAWAAYTRRLNSVDY